MSRVCIIGNSHLGAYKQALDGEDTGGLTDRFEFDTFGSIRASLLQTRIDGDRLVPTRDDVEKNFARTSGGKTEIRLSDYSAIVMAVRNSPFWIRPYLFDRDLAPVSDRMVEAIHREFLNDWSLELTAAIAAVVPDVPVMFVGRPLNTERDHLARGLLRQLDGDGAAAAEAIKDMILLRINRAVQDQPVAQNVTLVRPPDALLEPHRLFTRKKYARGAQSYDSGLKRPGTEDDTMHMNGDYGREMLIHMLDGL